MGDAKPTTNALLQWVKRQWLAVGLTSFLVCSAIGYSLYLRGLQLSDAENGANGLALGVGGVALSIAGFAVTFWQLSLTKSAAKAATEAVQNIRSQVATYDAIVETSRASALVRETQRHLRVKNWDSVLARYSLARECLIRLTELPSIIGDPERTKLRVMLADVKALSDRIESGLLKGTVSIDVSRALKESRDHEELMTKIEVTLQREIIS